MKDYFTELIDYEAWANRRVTEAFLRVENPPERAAQLVSHVLTAQHNWHARLTQQPARLKIWETIPTAQLLPLLTEIGTDFRTFVANLPEDGLDAPVKYANSKGEPFVSTVRQILTHLQLHAAYHRGQIVQLLKPLLTEVPATDYIFYTRQKNVV
ncbi:MAG: DUF664 domain-containing protein [Cytophagales bacterium]|jgi:uncharacterized damage-inducible protein DinB|nr:DUF664 domain-containing protein [Cytophagales bacterium]